MKKEKIVFDYEKLRALDMVICAGRSPFAALTRWVTSGFKNTLNHDIAVHVGFIIDFYGQKLIAEMQPKGLEINSLENYSEIGGRRWVISIRRNAAFNKKETRDKIQEKIALDRRRNLDYDYKGLFEFIDKRIKDNKDRAYCSEYCYQLTKDIIKYCDEYAIKVSPRDMQCCSFGWKDICFKK